MEGHDKFSYFTEQRKEGDLFKRDLVIGASLQQLVGFLSTRQGMVLAANCTSIAAGSFLSLGKIVCPSNKLTGGWAVYATVDDVSFDDTDTKDKVKIEMLPVNTSDVVTGASIFTVNGLTTEPAKWGATLLTDRGPVLVSDTIYDVRLSNTSAYDAICSARLVWNNKTT